MRTLSSTLQAAIGARTRVPALTLTAEDHINHLQQSIATTSNVDVLNDMCVASDGSLVRISPTHSITSPGTQTLRYQRITDPTNAAQWTAWTAFPGGSGNMFQDGGFAVSNNGGILRAFGQQGTGGNAVFCWTSTDNGQSWSGPVTVVSPPGSALTKGISSAGNNDVFFLYDVPAPGDAIGCCFFSAGTWSSLHTWTLPNMTFVTYTPGLAAVWNGTQYTVVYSDSYSLHCCTASSNGTTWTAFPDIAPATNSNIARLFPRLSLVDGLYCLVCIEADGGLYTGTVYNYPRARQSADLLHWSNGFILHDLPAYYGVCFVKTTPPGATRARYVAATLPGVQLCTDYQQSDSTQFIDLSTRIVDYQRIDELDKPSTLTVTLDNSGNALGSSVAVYGTAFAPIGLNTTLVLSEGYKTGLPPSTVETVQVGKYRIKQIVFERTPGENLLVLAAEDNTKLLDAVNRYQMTYNNQTLAWMISEICARAGLFSLSLPASAQMSTNVVTFVLHAGQKYRQALDELCRVGWLEYFLDQNETMQFRELSSTDTSVWTYQPEIETLIIGGDDLRSNHIIVSGLPPVGSYIGAVTNGEAYDDTHMHATGVERVVIESDPKLVTSALCASKAAFLLQQEQRDQYAHTVTAPCNPGLQLLDVIHLADQPAPTGTGQAANGRILKQEVKFEAEKGLFEQTLDLEGP
jgi:hypothetical protein